MTVPHPSTLATSINWRGGVESVSNDVDELNSNAVRANVNGTTGTLESVLANWSSQTNLKPFLFQVYGDVSSVLTNGATTSTVIGICVRNSTNFDYFTFRNTYAFIGRIGSDGTLSSLRSITMTSIL